MRARLLGLTIMMLLAACRERGEGVDGGAPQARSSTPTGADARAPTPSASGSKEADAGAEPTFDPGQRFAELGRCPLAGGGVIEPCRIGYRTFGTLDAGKSNAVLFPTWFTGNSAALLDMVPDKLIDTKRFFLILVDALGDGVSSSPSNSKTQPRLTFPTFTVRDMVEAQRRMAREVFGIERFHTVAGISMGGMQAFEWAVAHPEAMDRLVTIVGTPQLTAQDLLLWSSELHALDGSVAFAHGDYRGRPAIPVVQDIHWLNAFTPAHRVAETSRDKFPAWLREIEGITSFDWNDWHRQLEAMLTHDVVASNGLTSLEEAARRVTARALVVVATEDHMVNPTTSRDFAKAMGGRARFVSYPSDCGHFVTGCELSKLGAEVRGFLEK